MIIKLKYFKYDHLPENLRAVSKPFHDLAETVFEKCPPGWSRDKAIEKLLEAKDAAVRAAAIDSE